MADTGVSGQVISDGYREEQKSLHEDPNYGVASKEFAPLVAAVIGDIGARQILDYGSGKGRLRESLAEHIDQPIDISEYDPAIPGKDDPPEPSEMVVCLDVLEHIEPDLLDNVLDDLKRTTQRLILMTIHTGPAKKFLTDGRNAHLTQEDMDFWLPKIWERFRVHSFARNQNGFWVIAHVDNDAQ
tara:strand:- start:2954 stop:3508 length:555 start_codon:yes stop_codon:yes gene_type:complete